jgi:TrmH family RNA methyltransferase
VLVEGIRAVRELLTAPVEVRFAVISPRLLELTGGERLVEELEGAGIEAVEVSDGELRELAGTESPQGVLALCSEPPALEPETVPPGARLLLLDAVQDPGNVGTLVRTAAAFGVAGVGVLEGTVDPWSPKVVRASAGSSFRVPMGRWTWRRAEQLVRDRGLALFVGDSEGADVRKMDPSGGWALVVGNEGSGVRSEVLAAGTPVSIPMPGGVESLNAGVAGAILLYALTVGKEPS